MMTADPNEIAQRSFSLINGNKDTFNSLRRTIAPGKANNEGIAHATAI
jgi:hypothetical protein